MIETVARNDPTDLFPEPVCNLKLVGQIVEGDGERLKVAIEALERVGGATQPGLAALCLASEGGDIRGALKMGDLVVDAAVMTVVEGGDRCISACAMLFMAAKPRFQLFANTGSGAADRAGSGRYLHYTAHLAFHAPSLEIGANATLTHEEASRAYSRAIATLAAVTFRWARSFVFDDGRVGLTADPTDGGALGEDQLSADSVWTILENSRFQQELRLDKGLIPSDLLLALMTVPPDRSFRIDTLSQLQRWGIEPYGFPLPRHVSERMLFAACANLASQRCTLGGPRAGCVTLASRRRFFGSGGDDEYVRAMGQYFGTSKRKLWPAGTVAQGRVSAHGYTVTRVVGGGSDYKVCEARAIYRDGRLVGLDMDTFHGQSSYVDTGYGFDRDDEGTLLASTSAGIVALVPNAFQSHLRPWMMLPGYRAIADLGRNPWAELEKGGPAFAP